VNTRGITLLALALATVAAPCRAEQRPFRYAVSGGAAVSALRVAATDRVSGGAAQLTSSPGPALWLRFEDQRPGVFQPFFAVEAAYHSLPGSAGKPLDPNTITLWNLALGTRVRLSESKRWHLGGRAELGTELFVLGFTTTSQLRSSLLPRGEVSLECEALRQGSWTWGLEALAGAVFSTSDSAHTIRNGYRVGGALRANRRLQGGPGSQDAITASLFVVRDSYNGSLTAQSVVRFGLRFGWRWEISPQGWEPAR